jgi:hypothetical protein
MLRPNTTPSLTTNLPLPIPHNLTTTHPNHLLEPINNPLKLTQIRQHRQRRMTNLIHQPTNPTPQKLIPLNDSQITHHHTPQPTTTGRNIAENRLPGET